jgi:hypothetical protein
MSKEDIVSCQFKPGQSGNPAGSSKNRAISRIRRLTIEEVATIATMVIRHSTDELEAIADNPKSSVIRAWLAAVALKGIEKGDYFPLDAILNRIIGTVKTRIEHSGDIDSPVTMRIEAMTHQQRLAEIERLRQIREATEPPSETLEDDDIFK